ncbi:hypothetical protein FT663_04137 [Candidozyma haemuli var. vulneris]|uniref:Peptidase S54 rhomboid domain-containing protein n=1 Tax=Candidozyma haemuli TaxID=45357 RepID=A0A2V1AQ83_9ASCO|nr:hypothetical protein CXQ85_003516 [[Candida] haemuloni]KAF3987429.1 hypothetical protein FT662_03994 [[Candida] haemuloni var. vulneris]KAF3988191.1 hypothetical protein FT663_04137 [[Candida] haemuloni var. vulneris]PVH19666.1 hypothetical protein CXQ85_003516 [[Candida] haemuloni]
MNPPKVASIVTVAVVSLSLLNAVLKYYTYFSLIVAAHKSEDTANSSASESEVPHPHDLYVPFLTFVPTRSPVALRPWVLLTASFIEESFFSLTLATASVFYLGWYLEAKWGARAFLKFILVAVLTTNMGLYFWYAAKNALWHSTSVPPVVSSTTAIIMACLVAVKQRIANHYVILYKNLFRIKVTYIPFCWYVFLFIVSVPFPDWHIMHCEALVAFAASWIYLRFFKEGANERQSYLIPFSIKNTHVESSPLASPTKLKFDENLPKGDRSNSFALYTFFPSYLGSFVKLISNTLFESAVHHGILNAKDFIGHDEDDMGDPHVGGINSKLFSLSRLKGAENVGMMPHAGDKFKSFFGLAQKDETNDSIKMSMEKRRKLAIRQLE